MLSQCLQWLVESLLTIQSTLNLNSVSCACTGDVFCSNIFAGSRRCQIYTCIDGVIVNGTAANIHFTCDDPGATFKCRLNGKTLTPCKQIYKRCNKILKCMHFAGVSPLQLSDLPQGGNIVDITPVCERTASGKRESITFTV